MGAKIVIDYDKLVADYWQNLTTILRGFNPSEEFEFLEMWVPNDDVTNSLIEMVEAAEMYNVPELTIIISEKTQKELDISKFSEIITKTGNINVSSLKNDLSIEVFFNE